MLLRYLSSSSTTATSCLAVQLRKISSASSPTTFTLRSQSSFSLSRHARVPNNIHYTAANNNCNRHLFHNSAIRLANNDNDNVYVSLETASSKSNNIDSSNNSSSSGSSCSQGIPLDQNDNDEEEQEEMFVVADPILGHGTRKEWGGPRRGGSLAEPTRFGDWERKGRCTDF